MTSSLPTRARWAYLSGAYLVAFFSLFPSVHICYLGCAVSFCRASSHSIHVRCPTARGQGRTRHQRTRSPICRSCQKATQRQPDSRRARGRQKLSVFVQHANGLSAFAKQRCRKSVHAPAARGPTSTQCQAVSASNRGSHSRARFPFCPSGAGDVARLFPAGSGSQRLSSAIAGSVGAHRTKCRSTANRVGNG